MSSKDDVGKNVSARAQAVGEPAARKGQPRATWTRWSRPVRSGSSRMSCQVFSCLSPVTKARQGILVVFTDPPHCNLHPRGSLVNGVFLCPWVTGWLSNPSIASCLRLRAVGSVSCTEWGTWRGARGTPYPLAAHAFHDAAMIFVHLASLP